MGASPVSFNPGERVRYVGDVTERDCDATVETVCPDGRFLLRLGNGAAFFADPADMRANPPAPPGVWPLAFPSSARISG